MSDTYIRQAPTLEMLRSQRNEILALAEHYGASKVRVFGSVARGEATSDSDIDLLVHFRDGVSMWDVVGLWLDLKDLLEREVSLIADETPDIRFMQNVLQEAIVL